MKFRLKRVLLCVLVVILLFFIWHFHIRSHDVLYEIDNYKIKEHYYKDNKDWYDIVIHNKKNKYVYTINQNLNKNKRIIKQIKSYKNDELACIVPIYKKDIKLDIYCNLNKENVSKDYLLKTNNSTFSKIIKKAKINILEKGSQVTKKYKQLEFYKNNILENHAYILWNYKGFYVLNSKDALYKKVLDYDIYDNIMATIVDNYYVLFDNSSVDGIQKIYYYDILKDKLRVLSLKKKISRDSYINGVNDSLIYVTDNREKRQFSINIRKKKVEVVDKEQTSYIVFENQERKELSKSDFFMKKQFFVRNDIVDKKIKNVDSMMKEYNYYYYQKENKIYKVLDKEKDSSILLLELDNLKDWYVVDREIILLQDDTLFSYSDDFGLRPILQFNELKYNYKNIYKMWKK